MARFPLTVSMRKRGSSSSLTTCSTSCCSRARWTDGSEVFFIALHTSQTKEQKREHDHCPYPAHDCEDAVETGHKGSRVQGSGFREEFDFLNPEPRTLNPLMRLCPPPPRACRILGRRS